MPGASLALFADWGACHVQKSSVTICVLPAPSGWRATRFKMLGDHAPIIISIHALRVEGDIPHDDRAASRRTISIHALRVEGDLRSKNQERVHAISIHALRVEGDPGAAGGSASKRGFLSTPSGWRATCTYRRSFATVFYFYPRPPGGGRLKVSPFSHDGLVFLSTPSGWRATTDIYRQQSAFVFLSMPSGWRATWRQGERRQPTRFLSTPSGWRATDRARLEEPRGVFLSTPSGWRATGIRLLYRCEREISIHALRVEGDRSIEKGKHVCLRFLSTPSGWRATGLGDIIYAFMRFLSTPSGWRATGGGIKFAFDVVSFLSTPSGWRATSMTMYMIPPMIFLSTPSGWRATSRSLPLRLPKIFLSTPSGWRATATGARLIAQSVFLSTPSGWRATFYVIKWNSVEIISIHALRVEGDR